MGHSLFIKLKTDLFEFDIVFTFNSPIRSNSKILEMISGVMIILA